MIGKTQNGNWDKFLALVPPADLAAPPPVPVPENPSDSYRPSTPVQTPTVVQTQASPAIATTEPAAAPTGATTPGDAPPPPAEPVEVQVQEYIMAEAQQSYRARESVFEKQAANYAAIAAGGNITPIVFDTSTPPEPAPAG